MRIKVTITYEYDAVPEHYPDDCQTPTEMAKLDLAQDVVAMLEGEETAVTAVEV
jgi:hypothetical protein